MIVIKRVGVFTKNKSFVILEGVRISSHPKEVNPSNTASVTKVSHLNHSALSALTSAVSAINGKIALNDVSR